MYPSLSQPAPSPVDLANLRYADSVEVGRHIRALGAGASDQQTVAQRLVEYLYQTFQDQTFQDRALQESASAKPSTALVRCFQTHPFCSLPAETQSIARSALVGGPPESSLRCLTLLGTAGEEPAWNKPETSTGHRAIPLPNAAMIQRAPMIAALLAQMGVDVESLVAPAESFVLDAGQRSFNVFHVEEAQGSAYIPAQQTFVLPHGIRSVVGMGGLMPSGELFAVILFSKVRVSREVAELFRTLALSVKLLFLPFSDVFPGQSV